MITGCKVSQIVLDETNFLLGVQQRVYSSGVSKTKDSICHYHCGIFQIILPDESILECSFWENELRIALFGKRIQRNEMDTIVALHFMLDGFSLN